MGSIRLPSVEFLPDIIFRLILVSNIVCLIIFVISLLDLGFASIFIDPSASLVTFMYHNTIVYLSCRDFRVKSQDLLSQAVPRYTTTSSFTVSIVLILAWLGGAVMTISTAAITFPHGPPEPPASKGTIVVQSVLALTEVAIMGVYLRACYREAGAMRDRKRQWTAMEDI